MNPKKVLAIYTILIFLGLAIIAIPAASAANVTYPAEYYQYKERANEISWTTLGWRGNPQVATDYRTAALLIALEKQNELLAEQNELLRNMTTAPTKFHCTWSMKNYDINCEAIT